MIPTATLIELFASIQGEGAYVGYPQVFIRFHGCSLRCTYCDTPETHRPAGPCKVFSNVSSKTFISIPNPVSVETLNTLLATHYSGHRFFSITGGEPLEQIDFLETWLPIFKENTQHQILLETAGVHTEPLKRILPYLDIISMDLKPQSATGMSKNFWNHHFKFLQAIQEQDSKVKVYLKLVINEHFTPSEEAKLLNLITHFPQYEYFFQPVTPMSATSLNFTVQLTEKFYKKGFQTRFLPQLHPLLRLK